MISLESEDGTDANAYVLMNGSENILKWFPQAIPGKDISDAINAYEGGGFSAGPDMAFSLDLEGSGRFGDSADVLYKEDDKESEVLNFTWEKTEIILTNFDPNSTMTPNEAFEYYTNLWTEIGQTLDLSNRI